MRSEERHTILAQLNLSPLVAFTARKFILKSILEEGSYTTKSTLSSNKRKHSDTLLLSSCWFEDGIQWALSPQASVGGVSEWLRLLNKVLKTSRSQSHPEKFSGVPHKDDQTFPSKEAMPKSVSKRCVQVILPHLRVLWNMVNAGMKATNGSDNSPHHVLALELLMLCGRCVKEIHESTSCFVSLHSPENYESSSVIIPSTQSIDNKDECLHKIVYLHFPLKLNGFIRCAANSTAVISDIGIRTVNLFSIMLRHPNRIYRVTRLCATLLCELNHFLLDPHFHSNKNEMVRRDVFCSFIDSSGSRMKGLSLLTWARALCVVSSQPIDSIIESGISSHLTTTQMEQELSSSKFLCAKQLISVWKDNDQWLISGSLDLAKAHNSITSLESTCERSPYPKGYLDNPFLLSFIRLLKGSLHPAKMFVEVSKVFCFDEAICLDLILSTETPFLEYLLLILRLPRFQNYQEGDEVLPNLQAHQVCQVHDPLSSLNHTPVQEGWDETDRMLVRLKVAVERADAHGLFPFSPRALLSRFKKHLELE